jgi:hypothetical protein
MDVHLASKEAPYHMTETSNPAQIAPAASAAGIQIVASAPATSIAGNPTTRYTLALATHPAGPTLQLELSDDANVLSPELAPQLHLFLTETANRLRNPRPDAFLTLTGIPLTYSDFAWPFHESTAGADTSLVHGQINLLISPGPDGAQAVPLHAKVAASMTVTFRDIVRVPEQPFAESFILNAVRKTLDQGQLELVKSGNRQPVPVTTRFYSARQQKFIFNDTTEPQRRDFLAAKTFWLSASPQASSVAGGEAPASAFPLVSTQPVWLLDPRDAQYLNSTVAELKVSAEALAKEGLITLSTDPAYATPTPALLARQAQYHSHLAEALAFIKPTFNEEMRGGHTNM